MSRSVFDLFLTSFISLLSLSATALAVDEFAAPDRQVETIPVTRAEDSLNRFRMPEGFHVSPFASEPNVRNPIAMTFDHKGRLWVAENYTYANKTINYDESLRDRIIILEDTNNDGRFDLRKVFWDEGRKLTSIEIGFGGVWATCAPELLFIPDRDGDDKPDSEPEVLLDGWNDKEIRHNIVNGLKWGPDGWLYGRHGIQGISRVGKPGAIADDRVGVNCAIWRYHPTTQVFEVVCHGTTNSWGHDWDSNGELFFINTVIGHLWHGVPGAYFERMHSEHLNPYIYDLLPQTADHVHWAEGESWTAAKKGITDGTSRAGGGHAHCGMMIYNGTNWPERYRGNVFTLNMHGYRVNQDRLERRGSAYVGRHAEDMIFVDDPWFRGVELLTGPDGGVYIADWTDIGECHENDGVHRSTGRIFKVTFGQAHSGQEVDFTNATAAELVAMQSSPNEWHPRMARHVLHQRARDGVDLSDVHLMCRQEFTALGRDSHPERNRTQRLRLMWALKVTGGADSEWLHKQLHDSDEHVRTWAVRLLADQTVDSASAKALTSLAARETNGHVLLYLASALHRLNLDDVWPLARELVQKSDWTHDRFLPLMLWFGVEKAVPQNKSEAVDLIAQSRFADVRRNVARRITSDLSRDPAGVEKLVRLLTENAKPTTQGDILRGMNLALSGQRQVSPPPAWNQAADRLLASSDRAIREEATRLAVVFGDGRAVDSLVETAMKGHAPHERRNAIRSLVKSRSPEVLPLLQTLIRDREVAVEAIRGLAAFDDPQTPERLLFAYGRLKTAGREEIVDTLCSRPNWTKELLVAVEAGKIERGRVSALQIRQMNLFNESAITEKLRELWPELRHTAADKRAKIEEYQAILSAKTIASADASNGRALFEKNCAQCHTLFGRGGKAGPDLTGGQRSNLTYLLENIVDPSAQLAPSFRMSTLVLADGRIVNGVITQRSERTTVVQTPKGTVDLLNDDIEDIVESNLSMMPERLLDLMSDKEVADLIAYLQSK